MITLLFCLSLLSPVEPSLPRLLPDKPVKDETGYLITDKTDIRFNGKACDYKDVPSDAEIIEICIGKDNRTVQRLYFQTKKKR